MQRQKCRVLITRLGSLRPAVSSGFHSVAAVVVSGGKDQELWKSEDWYPPLCPPTRLKKEILRDEDFRDVDSRVSGVPRSSTESFRDLTEYLTKDFHSDLQRLRGIFTWMGAQEFGTEGVNEDCTDVDSPLYYLKDDSFIDVLFARLCREAQIPCILVNGKAKGASYETGDDKIGSNNTWAVVYVKSSWRFVFPDWAFTEICDRQKGNWTLIEESGKPLRRRLTDSTGITISRVEEFWFLTDPEEMNCFCHPTDNDKQLLTHTWTEQKFYSLPHYTTDYFDSGWNLLSPTECIIKSNRGLCEVALKPPTSNSKLKYKLIFKEKHSGSELSENIQTERYVTSSRSTGEEGEIDSLLIRLPVEGRYKLEVIGFDGSEACSLVKFRIDCDFVPPDTQPFPSQLEIGFGFGETAVEAGLSEPSHTEGLVPVTTGQEIDFSFKVEMDVDVSARLVHATRPPEGLVDNVSVQREETTATVIARLPVDDPKPEYSLAVDTMKITEGLDGTVEKCSNVLNYLLTSDEVLIETTKDTAKELKLQSSIRAYDALAKDDATLFEEAVFDFETAEHQDPILYEKIKVRKAKYKQMLKEVRVSTKERNLDKLDTSIKACISVNLQRGDIEAAKRKLVLLYKEEVQKLLEEEKLKDLKECLDKVTNSCVSESVKKDTWFQDARDRHEELDLLEKNKENVRSMVEEDIADLCRPPDKILDVIFATLVLLGDSHVELVTWQQILTKMSQLLERMGSYQERSLTPEQVKIAEERLNRHAWTSHHDTIIKRLNASLFQSIDWIRRILQVETAGGRLNRHDLTSHQDAVAKKLYTWCINRIRLHELRKKKNQPG